MRVIGGRRQEGLIEGQVSGHEYNHWLLLRLEWNTERKCKAEGQPRGQESDHCVRQLSVISLREAL